ncbi:MAG: hypothetical protein IKF98_13100, partial [Clostridia bacterium]|nr:hypothetical protein [Clostridia bacterium]
MSAAITGATVASTTMPVSSPIRVCRPSTVQRTPVTVPAAPAFIPPVTPVTSTASVPPPTGSSRSRFSGVTIQLPPPAWAITPSTSRTVVPAGGSLITKAAPSGSVVRLSISSPSSAASSAATAAIVRGHVPAEGSHRALAFS